MVEIIIPPQLQAHVLARRASDDDSIAKIAQSKSLRPHAPLVIQTTSTNTANTVPLRQSRPSVRSSTASFPDTGQHTPQSNGHQSGHGPLITWSAFKAAHQGVERQFHGYVQDNYKNSIRLDRAVLDQIDPRNAMFLGAGNAAARINYARIAHAEMDDFAEQLSADQPVFWLTLISDQFTYRVRRPEPFNPKAIIAWTRGQLGRASYVGMVDLGLFSASGLLRLGRELAVSGHVHVLVWDVTEAQIAQICDRINERYQTLIPGVAAAHYRPLDRTEVAGRMLYAAKAPTIQEYRAWPRKKTNVDEETGEIDVVTTGRFTFKPRPMRPGNMARVHKLLAGTTIDQLAFAAGAGTPILRRINMAALAAFRAWEAQQPYMLREAARVRNEQG